VEYEIRNDTLNLSKDIYSYTYFNFVKNHNPVMLGELMVKCFFTIGLQMAIIYYKFKPLVVKDVPVFRGDAGLNSVRLICTFIMHLYTFPNIRRGQQMIQFALYNTHKFPQRSAFWPLILACLKMVGALAAEYGNIFNIMRD